MTALPDTISSRWTRLRAQPVQALAWLDLARDYASRDLAWHAGYAARQTLRIDAALAPAVAALRPDPEAALLEAEQQMTRADLAPALAGLPRRLARQVAACPGDWLSWLYLARLLDIAPSGPTLATLPDPAEALHRAQACEPVDGETLHWLGVWRLGAGDAAGALALLGRLVDLRPMRHGSMMLLGEALLRLGRVEGAEKAFARASLSDHPGFLLTLSSRTFAHNYWREAVAVLHKALALHPGSLPHLLALAEIHETTFQLAECRATLERILAIDPGHERAVEMLEGLSGRMGDVATHFAALRQRYASGGDPLSRLASRLAMLALYHDGIDGAAVAALHREVCAPIEAAHPPRRDFPNPRTHDRVLNVGYVTGDLHRQHPVNLFMLPVLLRHDHARFRVHVYYTGTLHDEYTQRARASSERWVEAAGLTDEALGRIIGEDGIDILVDLAGHTASHRLGVFARRAAPVQATFLGYPHSTGLATVDWLIGDPVVTPAGHAALYTERLAQLPGSVFCWAPVDDYPLPPPRGADAPLVFGSFNNTMKLSPKTVRLWAAVLTAVPDARLLLKSPSMHEPSVQGRYAALFAAHGVDPARLAFRGPTGLDVMMQEYGDVDVALDPAPYNGGTTTLQALWMGVPVVTLEGDNFVSRMGASFMRALGRPEWVGSDEAGYVAAAVRLAGQRDALRAGRAGLRARMLASPLSDIDRYAGAFEAVLARIWTAHCDGDGRRVLGAMA